MYAEADVLQLGVIETSHSKLVKTKLTWDGERQVFCNWTGFERGLRRVEAKKLGVFAIFAKATLYCYRDSQ